MMQQTEIVIIGGGPVGLWTAIQLKKQSEKRSVIVYERYPVYKRSHVLNLRHLSVFLYNRHHYSKEEAQFYKELLRYQIPSLGKSLKSSFIRTNELEKALKTFAETLNVEIRYKEVTSIETLASDHPGCSVFIGADGAHSKVRHYIFNNEFLIHRIVQHAIEMKYDVKGSIRKLPLLSEQYKTLKLLPYLVFEYIGRLKGNITPVTLRVFLPKKAYDLIEEANYKNPVLYEELSNKLPLKAIEILKTYLNIRKNFSGDEIYYDSFRATKLGLSVYTVKNAARIKDGKYWFLVGDASLGVPFFRSLNSGLICGSMLARLLSGKEMYSAVTRYNRYHHLRFTWEAIFVFLKLAALRLVFIYLRISHHVPWQVNKWTEKQVASFIK